MTTSELYRENQGFRTYVDKFCISYHLDTDEALSHALVKDVAHQYENPDDTYTFGNIEPLGHLSNGDRIRSMTDKEIAEDRIECMNQYRSPYKGWIGDFEGVRDTREKAVVAEIEWLKREVP